MEHDFNLPIGSVALSRFKILKSITVGDQSRVYATQDTITGILYTLKLTRSLNEPLALELVGTHPNVVSIFRTGLWFDTSFRYMVLDTCQGDLQSHILQSHQDSAHFLNADRYILSTFVQILDAVEYCHVRGVYHRDLKPANIFVCDGGLSLSVALDFSPNLDPVLDAIFQHNPKNRVSISELRNMIVHCSEFRRMEPFRDTMPLGLASERVLVSDGAGFADELAQAHQYYDTGDIERNDTTDWYQLSAQGPEYTNCDNDCNMALSDSELCSKHMEECHALCNAPYIWTDFAGEIDAVDRFGLQVIHGAAA
ncbi:MAG: hypothetical protein LQ343_005368 [Gyalolechia ehrenbergii]|nr:MAG: hypothetical protein LQ343_005368 [Gyalolechia ehrenbergii]